MVVLRLDLPAVLGLLLPHAGLALLAVIVAEVGVQTILLPAAVHVRLDCGIILVGVAARGVETDMDAAVPGLHGRIGRLHVRHVELALAIIQLTILDVENLLLGRVVVVLDDVVLRRVNRLDVSDVNLEIAEVIRLKEELALLDESCFARQERTRLERDLVRKRRAREKRRTDHQYCLHFLSLL